MEITITLLVLIIILLVGLNVHILNKVKVQSSNTKIPDELSQIPTTLTKVVEKQAQEIDSLSKQLDTFKRKSTGVNVKWDKSREDKAAYRIIIYNDSPERIFNISVEIDQAYREVSTLYSDNATCDAEKHINAFFLPGIWAVKNTDSTIGRQKFCEAWLQNKLEPIKFVIRYTKTPSLDQDYQEISLYFATDNLTKHLKTSLQALKSHPLTLVSKSEKPSQKPSKPTPTNKLTKQY
jgi:hypothetical protein